MIKKEKVENLVNTYKENKINCYSPHLANLDSFSFPSDENQSLAEIIVDDLLQINALGINCGFDGKLKGNIKELNGILDKLRTNTRKTEAFQTERNKVMATVNLNAFNGINFKKVYIDLLLNTIDGLDEIKASQEDEIGTKLCDFIKKELTESKSKAEMISDFASVDAQKLCRKLISLVFEARDKVAGGAIVLSEAKDLMREIDEQLDSWIKILKAGKRANPKDVFKIGGTPIDQVRFSKVEDTFSARTKTSLFKEKYALLKSKVKTYNEKTKHLTEMITSVDTSLNEKQAKRDAIARSLDELKLKVKNGDMNKEVAKIEYQKLVMDDKTLESTLNGDRVRRTQISNQLTLRNNLINQISKVITNLDMYEHDPVMLGVLLETADLEAIVSLLEGAPSKEEVQNAIKEFDSQLLKAKIQMENIMAVTKELMGVEEQNMKEFNESILGELDKVNEKIDDEFEAFLNDDEDKEKEKEEVKEKKTDIDIDVF